MTDIRVRCRTFTQDFLLFAGRTSRPLYLHVVRYHLADQVKRYNGIGAFNCEMVERFNLQIRQVQQRRSQPGRSAHFSMLWSAECLYIQSRTDLLILPRTYKKTSPTLPTKKTRKEIAQASTPRPSYNDAIGRAKVGDGAGDDAGDHSKSWS